MNPCWPRTFYSSGPSRCTRSTRRAWRVWSEGKDLIWKEDSEHSVPLFVHSFGTVLHQETGPVFPHQILFRLPSLWKPSCGLISALPFSNNLDKNSRFTLGNCENGFPSITMLNHCLVDTQPETTVGVYSFIRCLVLTRVTCLCALCLESWSFFLHPLSFHLYYSRLVCL